MVFLKGQWLFLASKKRIRKMKIKSKTPPFSFRVLRFRFLAFLFGSQMSREACSWLWILIQMAGLIVVIGTDSGKSLAQSCWQSIFSFWDLICIVCGGWEGLKGSFTVRSFFIKFVFCVSLWPNFCFLNFSVWQSSGILTSVRAIQLLFLILGNAVWPHTPGSFYLKREIYPSPHLSNFLFFFVNRGVLLLSITYFYRWKSLCFSLQCSDRFLGDILCVSSLLFSCVWERNKSKLIFFRQTKFGDYFSTTKYNHRLQTYITATEVLWSLFVLKWIFEESYRRPQQIFFLVIVILESFFMVYTKAIVKHSFMFVVVTFLFFNALLLVCFVLKSSCSCCIFTHPSILIIWSYWKGSLSLLLVFSSIIL